MSDSKRLELFSVCDQAESVGIGGHVRPDGDCVGSCLACYLFLKRKYPDKRIELFLEKPAEIFCCIAGFDEINSEFPEREPFDVFFVVDCAADRLGEAESYFRAAKYTVNIDHHISNENGCGIENVIDVNASSTAELMYGLIGKENLDAGIAKAIYIGMIHDTGVFHYSCTSPKTLRIAADLIEYGFDFPKIIDETFYEKTYVQNQILGRAVLESFLFMDGKCIVGSISRKTMEFYGAEPKDLDGIVNQLRITKGVEVAIFLYETDTLTYKVSLRSCGGVDVARIAAFFGGGGHVRAAGCTMTGTFHDVVNNLSAEIAKQL